MVAHCTLLGRPALINLQFHIILVLCFAMEILIRLSLYFYPRLSVLLIFPLRRNISQDGLFPPISRYIQRADFPMQPNCPTQNQRREL